MGCIENESQEDQEQPEGGGFITPKNCTTNYLTVTTAYVLLSVNTTVDEYVLTIAPVYTPSVEPQHLIFLPLLYFLLLVPNLPKNPRR